MQDPKEPLWNLSIEDLFVASPGQAAVSSPVPVVINLRSSSAPVRLPHLEDFAHLKLWRVEDQFHGRPRFRLRLGFFPTRTEAEAALARLRNEFSSAFVANVEDTDLPYASEEVAAQVRAARAAAPKRRKDDIAALSGTPELDAALRQHEHQNRRADDRPPPKPKDVFELFPDDHPAVAPRPVTPPAPAKQHNGKSHAAAKAGMTKKGRKPPLVSRPDFQATPPVANGDAATAKHSAPAKKHPPKVPTIKLPRKAEAHSAKPKAPPREKACPTLSRVASEILNDFDFRRLDEKSAAPGSAALGGKQAPVTAPVRTAASAAAAPEAVKADTEVPSKEKAVALVPAPAPGADAAATASVAAPVAGAPAATPAHLSPESVLDALQTAPKLPVLKVAPPVIEPDPEVAVDDVAALVQTPAASTKPAEPSKASEPSRASDSSKPAATPVDAADTEEMTIADDDPTIEVLALSEDGPEASKADESVTVEAVAVEPELPAADIEFEADALELSAAAQTDSADRPEMSTESVAELESSADDLPLARADDLPLALKPAETPDVVQVSGAPEQVDPTATTAPAEIEAQAEDIPVLQDAVPVLEEAAASRDEGIAANEEVIPELEDTVNALELEDEIPVLEEAVAVHDEPVSADVQAASGTQSGSAEANDLAASAAADSVSAETLNNDDTAFDLEVLALELDASAEMMVAAGDGGPHSGERVEDPGEARAGAHGDVLAGESASAVQASDAEEAALEAKREAERLAEIERAAAEARAEAERIAEEARKAEAARREAERIAEEERAAAAAARAEAERFAEAERAAAAAARAEAERIAEAERAAAAAAKAEAERIAAAAEAERAAAAAAKAEAERILEAARKAEAARLEAERLAEAERAAAAAARKEAERLAEEARRAEAARLAAEQAAEAARREAERIAEEKRQAEAARLEAERLARERQLAEEKRRAEEAAAAEAKRIAEEKAAAEARRAAEEKRAAQEKAAAAKVVSIAPKIGTAAPKPTTPKVADSAPAAAAAAATVAATASAPAPAASALTAEPVNGKPLEDKEAALLITQAEAALSKWYAVQIAVSDEPPNMEQLPQLEIFAEYQLYTTDCVIDGRVRHVVRLGFFGNDSGAQAVAAYLKVFFEEPTITRVSVAEHDRFSRRKLAPEPPPEEIKPERAYITYAEAASARAAARRGEAATGTNGAKAGEEPRRRWTDGNQPATADKNSTSSIWKRLFK